MKICTDLEQSKKLLQLGVDRNTADMFWDLMEGEYPEDMIPHCYPDRFYIEEDEFIPAWSLSALLGILAKETHNIDEDGYIVLSSYKGNWWNVTPINCVSEEIKKSNDPLDGVFEMVVWLKEEDISRFKE